MRSHIKQHCKTYKCCQKDRVCKLKYRHCSPKIAGVNPWNEVSVDLVGPYTIKSEDGTILDFMCLTMIDPATSYFEMAELPNTENAYIRKKDNTENREVIINKTLACIACLFNKPYLTRYPRALSAVFDNGSKFKLFFENLCCG